MFLFTTPPASTRETGLGRDAGTRNGATTGTAAGSASAGVVDAIRSGARSTGTEFDYLLATAKRESSLDPSAKAATSSATGLFQFIEQTWLGTMKNAGPKLGLSAYADAITARPNGTYAVEDATTRQTILDLRRDPAVAATMAGALTQRNGEALTAALGREPTGGRSLRRPCSRRTGGGDADRHRPGESGARRRPRHAGGGRRQPEPVLRQDRPAPRRRRTLRAPVRQPIRVAARPHGPDGCSCRAGLHHRSRLRLCGHRWRRIAGPVPDRQAPGGDVRGGSPASGRAGPRHHRRSRCAARRPISRARTGRERRPP